ncbi:MAG: ZIP family metal transporter [Candidatus Zixiibacteriota bacterium]
MDQQFLIYNAILFAATFAVGVLTLVKKWDDEPLHLFVSYGAGVFLGVVFLHFIPDSLAKAHSASVPAMLLVGFLLIFFVEKFFLTRGDGSIVHQHKAIAITVLLGLTVHSLIEGMGLALLNAQHAFGAVLFYSILAHNLPAAISLVSLFLLARMSSKSVLSLLLLFSISTPGAAILSHSLFTSKNPFFVEHLSALTAGSLLYVATGELLPEVFHTSAKKWLKFSLLILGITTIVLLELSYN